jgi:hypothetical protein
MVAQQEAKGYIYEGPKLLSGLLYCRRIASSKSDIPGEGIIEDIPSSKGPVKPGYPDPL